MIKNFLFTGLLSFVCFWAYAQPPLKLGVVDVSRILSNAPQSETASQAIAKEFKPQEENIRQLASEISTLLQNFESDKLIMTDQRISEVESDIFLKKRNLKRLQDDFQEALTRKRNLKLSEILAMVRTAIVEVSEQEDYDLVLYFEGNAAYTKARLDITPKVIAHLKDKAKSDSK